MDALPAFKPPDSSTAAVEGPREIRFRHPAYPAAVPAFLILAAINGALDFDVALVSCCILAATPWELGYLATKAKPGPGFQKVDRPSDGMLCGREYYFLIEGREPSYKFPIVPSFHHWRFPHGNLPSPWKDLRLPDFNPSRPIKDAAMERDGSCRISGYVDALEKAHLVPAVESLWFFSNEMDRYTRIPIENAPINDDRNILILRQDLHHLFDTRRFTFVAKRFNEHPQLVTHVLLPGGSGQIAGLYHNRSLQPLCGLSVEFLFARFAWSLFTDEHIRFFNSTLDYTVCLWQQEKSEYETQILKGCDIGPVARIFGPSRSQSRSISPKKRPLAAVQTFGWGDDLEDDDGDSRDDGYGDREEPRGRPRKKPAVFQTFGCGDDLGDDGGSEYNNLGDGGGHTLTVSPTSAADEGAPVTPEAEAEGKASTRDALKHGQTMSAQIDPLMPATT